LRIVFKKKLLKRKKNDSEVSSPVCLELPAIQPNNENGNFIIVTRIHVVKITDASESKHSASVLGKPVHLVTRQDLGGGGQDGQI
jgi:hypothetical protein